MDKVLKSTLTNFRKSLIRPQSQNEKKDSDNSFVFGISADHLLTEELVNVEMTESQKRRATRTASVQLDQDNSVLEKQLDPKRLEDGFDPVEEIFTRIPDDEDVMDAWMAKEESELTSELKIIDDQVSHEASKNYNDFLKGIEMIQEIDLDLSRADIFVENSRLKLKNSQSVTEDSLSISAERRRLSRLVAVDTVIDMFRLLIDEERQMNRYIEDNNYVAAVKIATDIKQTLDEFNLSQYTCFTPFIKRINDIFPTLRQQLHLSLKEVLLSFDISAYLDIYKSYLYLDKALASSTTDIPSMSSRVVKAATEAIQEQALEDLRLFLHDHPEGIKIPDELIDSMGYMALAKETPIQNILPAILYIMNGICIVLHNHYLLTQVHAYYDDSKDCNISIEQLHSKSIAEEDEELQHNDSSDPIVLLRKQFQKSRANVWYTAQKIIADFINVAKLDNKEMKLDKFHEVYNVCQYFIKFGLTFAKTTSNDLNNSLRVKGYLYYNIIETKSLEKLKQALSVEMWNNIPSTLSEMGGVTSLLNITKIDESNMKSEQDIEEYLSGALTDWPNRGSPITPDTKIPYPEIKLPELGSIPDSFPTVLTNSLIQGFIRPIGTYLDFMISLPVAADTAFSGITKLIDTYVYSIFQLFTPDETIAYLFSDPDIPPPIYRKLTSYIRRIWLENFPETDPNEGKDNDNESSPGRSPKSGSPGRSPRSPGRSPRLVDILLDEESDDEANLPPPMFEVSEDHYKDVYDHVISKRLIAAETCSFIIELMSCIRALVQQLSISKSGESVVSYFSVLPDIIHDLNTLLYRASTKSLLEDDDHIEEWISKTKWEMKGVNTEHSSYVNDIMGLLNIVRDNVNALKEINMPQICIGTLYREVISFIMEDIYIAFSNVKKCNNEGRQQMQLDIDDIWTLATAIYPINPPIIKNDQYIKKYLKACMFINEADFLGWVNDEHENYSYDDVVSILNNNLAKKITKQKVKVVLQAIDSIYNIQTHE